MAKKYIGNFTGDAAKLVKGAERLNCQVDAEGSVYVCNGYTIFRMTPEEYAQIVQPVSLCDAGNWEIKCNCRKESTFDAVKVFRSAVNAAERAATMQAAPMNFQLKKGVDAVGMYNAAQDFTALYNRLFISAVESGAQWRAPSQTGAAVAYIGQEPVALVLPITHGPQVSRAIKAYFVAQEETPQGADPAAELRTALTEKADALQKSQDRVKQLEDDIAALCKKLEAARQKAQQLEEENGHLTAAAEKAEAPQAPKQNASKADTIAAQWAGVDGLAVVVKGAQTAAPIVWVSGKVAPHKGAIEAAGGRWSAKREAYYFHVA